MFELKWSDWAFFIKSGPVSTNKNSLKMSGQIFKIGYLHKIASGASAVENFKQVHKKAIAEQSCPVLTSIDRRL
jgi:hypothetical protein